MLKRVDLAEKLLELSIITKIAWETNRETRRKLEE